MSPQEAVLVQAMQLPRDQGAQIARKLIASLDEPAEPDVEGAWAEEAKRRLQAVESGASSTLPWEVVRERITMRLRTAHR